MPPLINAYGDGGFRIAADRHEGAVLIVAEEVRSWSAKAFDLLTLDHFTEICSLDRPPDILLVGCGERIQFLPADIRALLEEAGIGVDAMDTGAACRTFNVLVGEDRNVAAALLPI